MRSQAHTFLWHTTPLSHVPYLLQTGALLSAAELARGGHPIRPRPSAIRRKTKLGLADFVHLSPVPQTPLLRDKQEKGYAHVLLSFHREVTLALPGVALLKFNTKRWAHRDDFVPVRDADEKTAVWAAYEAGKYPSLEVLVPQTLPLAPYAARLHVATPVESEILQALIAALALPAPPICLSPASFPLVSVATDDGEVSDYFAACRNAGRVLPPPLLPFD
ncbi:MAG: hypothetical protein H7145_09485 [Akkermansiaceae bacterium]|nr:hypothetical protein [Armatimonadota bacterium]